MKRYAIFAHYSPTSKVAEYVLFFLKELSAFGFDVCFVSNSEICTTSRRLVGNICNEIIIRENRGLDFAMWQAALLDCDLSKCDELLLTNSSIIGPLSPLTPIWQNRKVVDCDFWGLTDNDEHGVRHLQSYFLVLKKRVLQSEAFHRFWRAVLPFENKQHVILSYELGFTSWLEQAGFKGRSVFDQNEILAAYLGQRSFVRKVKDRLRRRRLPGRNATLYFPDYLHSRGMPFLKMEVLRKGCCRLTRHKIFEMLQRSDLPAEVLKELGLDFGKGSAAR